MTKKEELILYMSDVANKAKSLPCKNKVKNKWEQAITQEKHEYSGVKALKLIIKRWNELMQ